MCGFVRPHTLYAYICICISFILRTYSLHGALSLRCMMFRDLTPALMS